RRSTSGACPGSRCPRVSGAAACPVASRSRRGRSTSRPRCASRARSSKARRRSGSLAAWSSHSSTTSERRSMERTYLEPAGVAPPPEPYSHAIRSGDTLYIAGQVAFDENNQTVGVGDARRQAEQVWHNIRLCVEAGGGTLADVVKITIFLKDIRH